MGDLTWDLIYLGQWQKGPLVAMEMTPYVERRLNISWSDINIYFDITDVL